MTHTILSCTVQLIVTTLRTLDLLQLTVLYTFMYSTVYIYIILLWTIYFTRFDRWSKSSGPYFMGATTGSWSQTGKHFC